MSKKKGANKSEQKRIVALQADGLSSGDISKLLYIEEKYVKEFMAKPAKKEPKKKAAPVDTSGD